MQKLLLVLIILLIQNCNLTADQKIKDLLLSKSAETEKSVCFISMDTACPLCELYLADLINISNENKDICNFYLVYNKQITKKGINILYDSAFNSCKRNGMKVTPEVLLIKKSKVIYAGKIDEYMDKNLAHRPRPGRRILAEVMERLRRGDEREERSEGVGCFME